MLACVDGDHIALDDGRLLGGDLSFSRFCPDPDALRRHVYGLGLGVRDGVRLLKRFQIRFPIHRLVSLVGGPWPVLEVSWREGWSVDKRRLGIGWSPRATWSPSTGERASGRAIEELLRFAEEKGWPGFKRGWWGIPNVPWEPVSRMPLSGAGYRRRGEPIIATTTFPKGVRAWWGSLNRRARESAPREVVLTADYVYGAFPRPKRLPRSALRASLEDGPFRVFVFGRRTTLVVEADGSLAAALDAQLARTRPFLGS
ncbi:MAG: hypothetical protein AAGE52_00775 [Myxococcota bacterium]